MSLELVLKEITKDTNIFDEINLFIQSCCIIKPATIINSLLNITELLTIF